jgi:hypothetical protein
MEGKEQVGTDQSVHPLTPNVPAGQTVPPGHVPLTKPAEVKGQDSQDKANLSNEETKVYTRDEVEALIAKRHSKLDSRINALDKQLKQTGNTAAENAELRKQIADLAKRHEDAELDRFKDDPEMYDLKKKELDISRREQSLSAKQAEVDAWMEENKTILDRLHQFDMLVTASELAKEYEIDPTDLLELGASTPEQMKKHAEYLAKKLKGTLSAGEKPAGKAVEKSTEKPKGMKPDSAVGVGAGADLSHLSPVEKIKMGLSQQTKK